MFQFDFTIFQRNHDITVSRAVGMFMERRDEMAEKIRMHRKDDCPSPGLGKMTFDVKKHYADIGAGKPKDVSTMNYYSEYYFFTIFCRRQGQVAARYIIKKYWDEFELRPVSERQTRIDHQDYDVTKQLTQPQRQKNMGLIIRIIKEYFDWYLLAKEKTGSKNWLHGLEIVDEEIYAILSLKQSEEDIITTRKRIVTFFVLERLCKAYQWVSFDP